MSWLTWQVVSLIALGLFALGLWHQSNVTEAERLTKDAEARLLAMIELLNKQVNAHSDLAGKLILKIEGVSDRLTTQGAELAELKVRIGRLELPSAFGRVAR